MCSSLHVRAIGHVIVFGSGHAREGQVNLVRREENETRTKKKKIELVCCCSVSCCLCECVCVCGIVTLGLGQVRFKIWMPTCCAQVNKLFVSGPIVCVYCVAVFKHHWDLLFASLNNNVVGVHLALY